MAQEFTIGIEEEYQIVDPETRDLKSHVSVILEEGRRLLGEQVKPEMHQCMGTVLGDDGGSHQIGMAPGAKWIGCRNMDQGNGTPARYLECFEFFMAPYPVGGDPGQGDPSLAPDLTTNSWSCTDGEGCTVGDELQAAVDAQKAAGIMQEVCKQNLLCLSITILPQLSSECWHPDKTVMDWNCNFRSFPINMQLRFEFSPNIHSAHL